jgi:uncharacterized protein
MPPTFPPPASITIDKTTARRFTLAQQHLWPPRQLKGKSGVLDYIQHIGCIQFDPINIVGRNPDLVLQARVRDYRPSMLDELLYTDRKLLDGWDKMASIYSLEDWSFFFRHKLFRRQREDPRRPSEEIRQEVLRDIKERGPLSSLDFDNQEKADWYWGPTKIVRAALESLHTEGYLGVHHRVSNRRYFDLIERLLPEQVLKTPDPNPSDEAYQDWHILRRVGSMGLVFPNAGEHWYGILEVKTPQRKEIITRLVERGELLAVDIAGIPDKIYFMRTADLPTLEAVQGTISPPLEAAIIGPLDNLIWNRKNNAWLFDFEYIWEVYKPKAKRQYGYYTLPVIYNDRFVARFDPAFDKKTRHLCIQNWWWEDGMKPDEEMQAALMRCFQDFAVYLKVESLEIGELLSRDAALRWMNAILV